jgi:NAD(P)H-dependent FMN reductase
MAARPLLEVIICSTRPGRRGAAVAQWVDAVAREHGGFDVELVDLAAVNLPVFDEPNHPMLATYVHEHTKAWSATVARADAFVFVMPEYNHSFNAALKNALDYLNREWAYKAVGLVSYGGVAAGTRAAQAIKPVLGALGTHVVVESINIPSFTTFINDDEVFEPAPGLKEATIAMLDSVARWTSALESLRAKR